MPKPATPTINAYIAAAPAAGQPHLRALHALLQRVAPKAEQVIKWGHPFFIEPRCLFSFSAHEPVQGFSVRHAGADWDGLQGASRSQWWSHWQGLQRRRPPKPARAGPRGSPEQAPTSHVSFAPSAEALEHFRAELAGHATTKNYLKLPYDQPLPEALIRRMAQHRVKVVAARTDDGFW